MVILSSSGMMAFRTSISFALSGILLAPLCMLSFTDTTGKAPIEPGSGSNLEMKSYAI